MCSPEAYGGQRELLWLSGLPVWELEEPAPLRDPEMAGPAHCPPPNQPIVCEIRPFLHSHNMACDIHGSHSLPGIYRLIVSLPLK